MKYVPFIFKNAILIQISVSANSKALLFLLVKLNKQRNGIQ